MNKGCKAYLQSLLECGLYNLTPRLGVPVIAGVRMLIIVLSNVANIALEQRQQLFLICMFAPYLPQQLE